MFMQYLHICTKILKNVPTLKYYCCKFLRSELWTHFLVVTTVTRADTRTPVSHQRLSPDMCSSLVIFLVSMSTVVGGHKLSHNKYAGWHTWQWPETRSTPETVHSSDPHLHWSTHNDNVTVGTHWSRIVSLIFISFLLVCWLFSDLQFLIVSEQHDDRSRCQMLDHTRADLVTWPSVRILTIFSISTRNSRECDWLCC